MASSFLEWSSPILDLDNAVSVTAFIKSFDDKMVEAGLIKIPEDSTEYTQPPNWPTTTINQVATAQVLAYRFPKGHAKVEFEDVAGQTYKKIKRASYYNTDCELLFTFKMLKASLLNLSLTDPDYMKKTTVLYCDFGVRSTSQSSFLPLGAMGHWGSINNNTTFNTAPFQQTRPNYIIHTEDSLTVSFGNLAYLQSNNTLFSNSNSPIISFSLKRSKYNNSNCIIHFQSDRIDPATASVNQLQMSQLNNNFVSISNYNPTNNNFHTWFFEVADANVGGEAVMFPYIHVHQGSKYRNDSMYVSRVVPENAVLTEDNAVVLYDNTPIIISTLNLGKHNKYLSIGNWYFSTVLMKPNYEVITGDLT